MLRVDKGRLAAVLLGLGHDVEGQGGFTGGLRSVDLDDAARSRDRDPVEMDSTFRLSILSPIRMIEPLPYIFSMFFMAFWIAVFLSVAISADFESLNLSFLSAIFFLLLQVVFPLLR